jgi:hypothetical protein
MMPANIRMDRVHENLVADLGQAVYHAFIAGGAKSRN